MKKFALIPLTAMLLAALHASSAQAIGRLANIEIQDRNEQRSLPIYWHGGRAYIVGRPGNEYQVVLRNQTDADVLAVVSVDGVNVISGETASPKQSGYVIDYGQRMEIAGWRKSMDRTAAFYFTSLGDSYAARTGRPDNVGVIGVALYRRKADAVSITPYSPSYREGRSDVEDKDYRSGVPNNAPAAPATEGYLNQDRAESAARPSLVPQAKAESPLGTGHGRSEYSGARYVSFERRTQNPEEQLNIYYDSYANLVARGIIAAPRPREPREPQAFPGTFVPDPWR